MPRRVGSQLTELLDYTKCGLVYSPWGIPSPDPDRYWHLWYSREFTKRFETSVSPLCDQFIVKAGVFSLESEAYNTVYIYDKGNLRRGVKYPKATMDEVCLICQEIAESFVAARVYYKREKSGV